MLLINYRNSQPVIVTPYYVQDILHVKFFSFLLYNNITTPATIQRDMFTCHVNRLTSKNMLSTHPLPPLFRGELYTPSYLIPLLPVRSGMARTFPSIKRGLRGVFLLKTLYLFAGLIFYSGNLNIPYHRKDKK